MAGKKEEAAAMQQVAWTWPISDTVQMPLAPGAVLLRGFAQEAAPCLYDAVTHITRLSPFRQQCTPGGRTIGVANTSCGACGWVSDARGYRYEARDPQHGRAWPALPDSFLLLAQGAAALAGFASYRPTTCLINRYLPGNRLALHQDLDENDDVAPIVSVSLGLPAIFLFGGMQRTDAPQRHLVEHGDVVVWGGPARMRFHGVLPLRDGYHPSLGGQRINLTFRYAAGQMRATSRVRC